MAIVCSHKDIKKIKHLRKRLSTANLQKYFSQNLNQQHFCYMNLNQVSKSSNHKDQEGLGGVILQGMTMACFPGYVSAGGSERAVLFLPFFSFSLSFIFLLQNRECWLFFPGNVFILIELLSMKCAENEKTSQESFYFSDVIMALIVSYVISCHCMDIKQRHFEVLSISPLHLGGISPGVTRQKSN